MAATVHKLPDRRPERIDPRDPAYCATFYPPGYSIDLGDFGIWRADPADPLPRNAGEGEI